jgi:hypothetical protein
MKGDPHWIVKLPAHNAGLPGNDLSFSIMPLDPVYKAGLAGQAPAKGGQEHGNSFETGN